MSISHYVQNLESYMKLNDLVPIQMTINEYLSLYQHELQEAVSNISNDYYESLVGSDEQNYQFQINFMKQHVTNARSMLT